MSERAYNCKDREMLLTSNVIMGNFNLHKEKLVAKRKTWADPFGPDLEQRIANGLELLGVDPKAPQTDTTDELETLQDKAMKAVTTFKVQLEVDFRKDPKTLKKLKKKLGLTGKYEEAQTGNQEAVVELLTTLKENMKPDIRTKVEASIDGGSIDDIIGWRDKLNDLNVRQESLKLSTPKETALNVDELNEIYEEVIGICKIAPRILTDVPTAREDFSFNRILSRLR